MTSVRATLDVHIGVWSPVRWDEIDQVRVTSPGAWGNRQRPLITSEVIKWDDLGLAPRWVDDDSSEAVAAIEPSRLHDHGAQEWERFCAGAEGRGELALAVSTLRPDDAAVPTALSRPGASVSLAGASSSGVWGEQITLASPPELVPGVSGADRDLALRLTSRPVGLPWWSLGLYGHLHQRPEGQLSPLLRSTAGEVVAAVWTSPGGRLRHYILPFMPSYVPILGWLVDQAVPEFVPSAARRLRASLAGEPLLQTNDEARTQAALQCFEADAERHRAELQANAARATVQADEVRDPLLYGSGKPLVGAVRRVLSDAGIDVDDLDELLGETVRYLFRG